MKTKNILAGLLLLATSSCSLDYTNNEVISPDNVWTDEVMIKSFLTDIYGRMTPGWPVNGNNTDEAMNGKEDLSEFSRGIFSVEKNGTGLGYGNIDRINFFLDNLETTTVLSETTKNELKGQALFGERGIIGEKYGHWAVYL